MVLDTAARLAPRGAADPRGHAGPGARRRRRLSAPADRVRALAAAGATVVRCRDARGPRRRERRCWRALRARRPRGPRRGRRRGSRRVRWSAGLVDRVALFVAPLLLGGRDAPASSAGAGRELKSALRLERVNVTTARRRPAHRGRRRPRGAPDVHRDRGGDGTVRAAVAAGRCRPPRGRRRAPRSRAASSAPASPSTASA